MDPLNKKVQRERMLTKYYGEILDQIRHIKSMRKNLDLTELFKGTDILEPV